MWFSMFVYIILCLFMLHADWQKSDSSVDGESQLQALLPFPAPLPERPRKLARRLVKIIMEVHECQS